MRALLRRFPHQGTGYLRPPGFIDRRFKAQVTRAAAKAGMGHNAFDFAMAQALRQPRSGSRRS